MINIAINGYGRIGRNIVRALYETGQQHNMRIVAINDLGKAEIQAHLTQFDTVHGRFNADVSLHDNHLKINHDSIALLHEKDPNRLPWAELNVDIVMECTGIFRSKAACQAHLNAGAKKVLISAPAQDADATIVYGINHSQLRPGMQVVSNASCTTNCLAPVAKILQDHLGIEQGMMTTIHAYTNDQVLNDVAHDDVYRARAAALNIIPTKTGAAEAVGLVVPALQGRFSGMAVRVPTPNVSLVDLNIITQKDASVEAINDFFAQAVQDRTLGSILQVNQAPLVSSDFNHSPYSSHFDATQTRVQGRLVKVMSWYDNEWGFSCRMLDTASAWLSA